MSVDDRLRRGLEANATSFQPEVEARLAALQGRHGRRRAVLAGAAAAVVLTGVGITGAWLGSAGGSGRSVEPVAPVAPTPDGSRGTTSEATPATGARVPDSAWRRTVTREQAVELGLDRGFLRDNFGDVDRVPLVLSFFGDAYSQSGRYAGRWQVGDAGTVSYDGDLLVLTSTSPGCSGCVAKLEWQVSRGTLRLSDPRGELAPDGRLMLVGSWSRQSS